VSEKWKISRLLSIEIGRGVDLNQWVGFGLAREPFLCRDATPFHSRALMMLRAMGWALICINLFARERTPDVAVPVLSLGQGTRLPSFCKKFLRQLTLATRD
jgi:hypothetical protein